MKLLAELLIAFVILEHLYFLWMEMFAWETIGKKVFKNAMPPDLFKPTKVLAANQGLYNGFLAAGLVWTFFIFDPLWKSNIAIFFLCFVAIAGIYGALTASKKIFFIQSVPAILAIICLIL
ncbi:MAG: DUF1304 domain-containing protein [Bacteroidetes bacterium]|nr:DUF1304 domain-containing protein [Bacteroidota bacterium]